MLLGDVGNCLLRILASHDGLSNFFNGGNKCVHFILFLIDFFLSNEHSIDRFAQPMQRRSTDRTSMFKSKTIGVMAEELAPPDFPRHTC